jgi:hypothetical protein
MLDREEQVENLRIDAPTLYLNFGGVLNIGQGLVDNEGFITLASGREPFEHPPILINLLMSRPQVQIIVTTSWLQTLGADRTIELLPYELRRRVVGTTRGTPPRLGELHNGSAKVWVPIRHARKHEIQKWLALDDETWGIPPGFEQHFLRTSPAIGLGASDVQEKLKHWLDGTVLAAPE